MHEKKSLKDYADFVGEGYINKIYEDAAPLINKHIVNINATYYGGGVAELLSSLVPLMNDLGLTVGWRLLKGNADFFRVTKQIHNALQGDAEVKLSNIEKNIYIEQNSYNSEFTHISHHDAIIVHDPQPLPLINFYKKSQKWIWRCHIDLSRPRKEILSYLLKNFISKFDHAVYHRKEFAIKNGPKPCIMPPGIDPLTKKNEPLTDRQIEKVFKKYGIDDKRPIISQISRFDKWKDPLGVIKSYHMVKRKCKCQLILLGSFATDDPDGEAMYKKLVALEAEDPDVKIIAQEDNELVNALQRNSAVVVQSSLKDGFALTVTESLFKGTPVVANAVGGIKLQIKNGWNGYLVEPRDHTAMAKAVLNLLQNEKLRKKMGKNGHDYVVKNFLTTRLLADWIKFLNQVLK